MKHYLKYPALVTLAVIIATGLANFSSQPAEALPTPVVSYTTPTTFTGANSVDLAANISTVAALDKGTVISRFKTTSSNAAKALISASNSGVDSANFTLSINGENLYLESRTATTTYQTKLGWPIAHDRAGRINDGEWHTAVVTVGALGTKVYLDGYQVHSATSKSFFNDIPSLNTLRIGGNVDSNGFQWGFVGSIDATYVYETVLSDVEIKNLYPAPDTASKWTADAAYSASTPLMNRLAASNSYNAASQGTMFAYFKTSASGVQTILSAGNTTHASTNITVALVDGALYYEHRTNGIYAAQFTVPGHWNDGRWHSVALRVNETGTVLFADGEPIERLSNTTAFMSNIPGLNGIWIGGNIDNGGEQWKFNGEIGRVKLYKSSLTASDIKNLSDVAPMPTQALFDSGYASANNYRIPSIIKTSTGTLIAGADQRTTTAKDSPNDINFVVRRSTDSGTSWSEAQVLVDYPGTGNDGASVIDSVLVQNEATGRIFAIIDRFPGGVGQANSVTGTGFASDGRKILYDGSNVEHRLNQNGTVETAAGVPTSYVIAVNGDIANGGVAAGNIHMKAGTPGQALREVKTAYSVVIWSDDDGLTWTTPKDITKDVKADWMRFFGTGPGNGIQLTKGANAGRVLVPVYFNNASSPANVYSSAMIYTDDNGLTWHRSASPNDGRVYNGTTIHSQTLSTTAAATHEPTIVERSDGSVLMLMRNLTPGGLVVKSATADSGATWGPVTQDSQLPDIFSQPNAVKFERASDEVILFANATKRFTGQNGATTRGTGVIRLSEDDGATWKYNKTFRADTYVYSNLVQIDADTIGLFWEMEWDGLYFTKIPLTWLTSSGG
ncbi:MAG: exo-alpha-sialidase [Rhodoglobus sp.]